MKGYIRYFKTQIIGGLEYKAAAIGGLGTQFFWGLLFVFIYTSFYSHTNISSISFTELMSYTWLGQAFFTLTYMNIKDNETINSIKNGTVAYELCRPYNIYTWWYIKKLSKRYANALLRCVPILIFGFLLPHPYALSLPNGIWAFIGFVLALFIGSLVVTSINMLITMLSFFTMEDKGIASIFYTIGGLLGGYFMPLPLLPDFITKISEYLPFRLIGDLSFRIYSGNISGWYAVKCILLGITWTIVLITISKMLMRKALERVCIQGG